MARMHSRKHGKAGSNSPVNRTVPSWARSAEEVELLVSKLAKEGYTPSKIGLVLRDMYGVPTTKLVAEKKITTILKEKEQLQELPEDLTALIKRAINIRNHLEENKQDQTARRGLILTESKIKRLVKYYKGTGRIAQDWKYHPDRIKLFVE
mgnify:CR=1 FL=1